MAFVLKEIDFTDPNKTATREFVHSSGLKFSFKSFLNPSFQKLYALITSKMEEDKKQELTLNNLVNQTFSDDELTYDEALVIAVGKYLIADWNVPNEKGGIAEINGINMMRLVVQLQDPSFVVWCIEKSSEVAKSIAEDLAATKKKSSSVTNGKKTTQA